MNILETTHLTKEYGAEPNLVKALDDVNITIEQGEFVAVIGTSGSGKSTLLNMLGGLDRPSAGSVKVDRYELGKLSDEDLTVFRRRCIGFVFQNYNLVPILNVYENIVMPIQLDGKKPDEAFIQEIITFLGLEKKLYHMPNTLSGGQQQRVSIARALAGKPAIILADEPTGRLYAAEVELAPSSQARENLKAFYTEERLRDFASYDPSFPVWKEGFDAALTGAKSPCTVFGADGLILEAAASENYLLNDAFDAEKFAEGNYCLAIGPLTSPSDLLPTYAVGETVRIQDREFEVMAVISPLQPMVADISQPTFDLPLVIPAKVFKELWEESGLTVEGLCETDTCFFGKIGTFIHKFFLLFFWQ